MNAVPEQADVRRRVKNWRLKVAGVGAGDSDADAMARTKKMRDRQKAEYQLDRLAFGDRR